MYLCDCRVLYLVIYFFSLQVARAEAAREQERREAEENEKRKKIAAEEANRVALEARKAAKEEEERQSVIRQAAQKEDWERTVAVRDAEAHSQRDENQVLYGQLPRARIVSDLAYAAGKAKTPEEARMMVEKRIRDTKEAYEFALMQRVKVREKSYTNRKEGYFVD